MNVQHDMLHAAALGPQEKAFRRLPQQHWVAQGNRLPPLLE